MQLGAGLFAEVADSRPRIGFDSALDLPQPPADLGDRLFELLVSRVKFGNNSWTIVAFARTAEMHHATPNVLKTEAAGQHSGSG